MVLMGGVGQFVLHEYELIELEGGRQREVE